MTTGSRAIHDFCWINLITPEGPSAQAFFARLFGWTFGAMPGVPGGQIIEVEGVSAGALMDLGRASLPSGTPPVIGVMVKVESADETVAKINALGGRADQAYDALDNGRMAFCSDPNGAVFGLWQPKTKDGFAVDSLAHGAPTWFETITSDVERAVKFYQALFGWSIERRSMPGMTYTLFKLGERPVAGAMASSSHTGNTPPHWATSFAVRSADETARLGVELGATLCIPVAEIAGVGRFAMLRSPQGVTFQLFEHRS